MGEAAESALQAQGIMGESPIYQLDSSTEKKKKKRKKEPQDDPYWRTARCQFFNCGHKCPYKTNCTYAHTEDELRPMPAHMPIPSLYSQETPPSDKRTKKKHKSHERSDGKKMIDDDDL